jgi:hypothetical protein
MWCKIIPTVAKHKALEDEVLLVNMLGTRQRSTKKHALNVVIPLCFIT